MLRGPSDLERRRRLRPSLCSPNEEGTKAKALRMTKALREKDVLPVLLLSLATVCRSSPERFQVSQGIRQLFRFFMSFLCPRGFS